MGQAEDMMHEEVVSWQTVRLSLTLIYIFQLIYQYTTICGIPNTDTSWNLFIVIWTCLFPILAWGITWLLVSKKKNQKDQTKNHVSFMKKYATQQRLYLLFYVLFFSIHSNGVAFGAGHQTV
jgi:tryptophan-rich sensory protein